MINWAQVGCAIPHSFLFLTMTWQTDPIAIIGMACRFPGGVASPQGLWQLLVEGRDAIGEVPSDRFDVDAYYDPAPATPGKINTRWGGFLDRIEQFDAAFFGLSPREAERMDPQQRLLLEVAWEALEDAGLPIGRGTNLQTGVFIGQWLSDFEARLFADPSAVDFYMTTGSGRYSSSGRLSYQFGFQGPSVTVDTACSSSLTAVHLACQSLLSGECALALAGAANVILQPHITIAYSQSKMMAPDGRCKFGDARANGYVRSEGAALLVLKPLSAALADKDKIYALIRGSAVNNDGRSSGFLTTPGGAGQEELLRKAYQAAGISPGRVQYVEAHGTGTAAGDPVEIGALGAVLAADRPADRPCLIGSIKTNIGHTESVAGLAGLMKVVLSLQHRQIPASLHLQEPNPAVAWDALPVKIQRELGPWPEYSSPAIGGVSAFGIAGTNAHIVVEEAPASAAPQHAEDRPAYVLPVAAHSPAALQDFARACHGSLADKRISVADLCYTMSTRRAQHDYRIALTGRSREDLLERLAEVERGEIRSEYAPDRAARIVFVFPGQGSQWIGMGRQLLKESLIFRLALERFDLALRPFVDWSVIDQLQADGAYSRLDEIDVIQPILCAIEIALAEVWRGWEVEPDAVIGHSMGEVAAAHIAGAVSLSAAARLIATRSRLMKQVSGQGAMAVVNLSEAEAWATLAGFTDRLSVAVNNSPVSSVLSGDPAALDEVLAALQAQNVFCRRVKVDVAAHSPQMDGLQQKLVVALDGFAPQSSPAAIYSTVTGCIVAGPELTADYWGRNLRAPVRFAGAVEQALAAGYDTFIEMSPHPLLLQAITQTAQATPRPAATSLVVLPSLRREEDELVALLTSLGAMYASGQAVNWRRLYPSGQLVSLPTYPWQRERFWFEPSRAARRLTPRERAHPLDGVHLESALQPGQHWWSAELDLIEFPYLADHRVHEAIVLPAAVYCELALSAARHILSAASLELRNVSFKQALALTDDRPAAFQLMLASQQSGVAAWQFLSRALDTAWTLNASGTIETMAVDPVADMAIESVRERCGSPVPAAAHYAQMRARGLEYGPAFQALTHIGCGKGEAFAEVRLPASDQAAERAYSLHPSILDAALQLLIATDEASMPDLYLPISIESLTFMDRADPPYFAYAVCHERGKILAGDVYLLTEAGQVVMMARNVCMQQVSRQIGLSVDDLFYKVHWMLAPRVTTLQPRVAGMWLILTDTEGVGQSLAAQLVERGIQCVLVAPGPDYARFAFDRYQLNPAQPGDWQRLFADIAVPCQKVVDLRSLEARGSVSAMAQRHSMDVLHLVQALSQTSWSHAPHVWLVTGGTQHVTSAAESIEVAAATVWGLGGVVAREYPQLNCRRIDLSRAPTAAEVQALVQELCSDEADDQIALRGMDRYVARLVRAEVAAIEYDTLSDPSPATSVASFRAVSVQPGILDRLELHAVLRQLPGPGQIEIEVQAASLNFMNVMSALGIYPGYSQGVGPLGIECAGVITAVGEGVSEWRMGDRVMGIAFDSLGTHVVTDASLVVRLTEDSPFVQAASIPIAFTTAYYALHHLAHLGGGERVLIHSATGGVGLAAVQIAQWLGAEIYATAGSEAKRDYLRSLGIQYVFDSRSLAFADEIRQLTNGQGVDVVLNSLAGEAIAKGLELLAPYGRFLEIGKRDIYQNNVIGLEPFRKNLSYFAIDLDRMARERPAVLGQLLREVQQLIEAGVLAPLPVQVFPVADIVTAFRAMAQAQHLGKLVIDLTQRAGAHVRSVSTPDQLIVAEATYLITGGAGGLGLSIARWLVDSGARHVVLMGRRSRSELPAAARQAIADLENAGVQIDVVPADVAHEAELAAALAEIDRTRPPLKGVIHAAGVLDDGVLLQQTDERFRAVLWPKVAGAWNLHTLTANRALDFFVLFSSVASVLGTAGQGNYAAANAALDALAHHRASLDLPALSINWGPWAEVGLAAQRDAAGLQSLHGIAPLSVEQGVQAWARLVQSRQTQIAVAPFDVRAWCEAHSGDDQRPFLALLLQANASSDATARSEAAPRGLRETLLAAEAGRPRRALLEAYLQEQAAQVLRLPPSRIETQKPLHSMGFDSLMTLEFRNRLEADLKISLPPTLVWNYPTINALVPYLVERLGLALDTATVTPAVAPVTGTQAASDLDDLSTAEIEALLADELTAADHLLENASSRIQDNTREHQ
jgi:acyl transferase domain-containing protein/NADPH:quinone reductase-like Zn-dependent oxidoreductase/acyl carrier protein